MATEEDRIAMDHKYHRDACVIAARKQYRADLKAGVSEREAWATASVIYQSVRDERLNVSR